ncbi:MAG: hypothetical protein RLZZ519_29 [Bacteroidota bacterium]
MKSRFLSFAFFLLIAFCAMAQSHSVHWANITPVNVEVVQVDADDQGNSIAVGHFSSQLIIGNDTLNSSGSLNVFIAKYDVNGTPIWARKFGGSSTDIVYGMGVDPLGFVYITGGSRSSMTVAGTVFPANQYGDFYLVKYAPNGNLLWALHGGTPGGESGENIGFDAQGNVYVAGSMGNALTIGTTTMPQEGVASAFVAVFSPQGQVLSTHNHSGPFAYNGARGIAVLANGDHYLVGQYDASVVFGTDTLRGIDNCWVAKFDAAGNYQWSREMQGPDYHVWYDVGASANGDVFLVGDFYDTLYFGGNVYPVVGLNDIIIAHYDANGNLLDHRIIATPGNEDGQSIAVKPNGDYYISGEYSSGASFGGPSMPSFGFFDLFVAKYSANGTYQWAVTGGSSSWDKALDVATDGQGRVYVVGSTTAGMSLFNIAGQVFNQAGGYIFKVLEDANHVSGRVAMDYNHNSIYEATDLPWNGGQVNLTPALQTRTTDADGEFDFAADTGTYTLNLPTPPSYYNLVPSTHTATFSALASYDTTNYFLLEPIPGITDVRVSFTALNNPGPGRDYWLRMTYQNVGTDTASGTVSLEHPNRFAFVSANPPANTVSVDTLRWNYSNLLPWETRTILVCMQPDTFYFIGQQIQVMADITPFTSDANQTNNLDTLTDWISTSYDPNDKLVSPAGPFTPLEAQNSIWLTYTIRFQNTGNDTAYVVRLRDSLQSNVDIASLELLDASHPYTFQMSNGIASWRFENILLPDSATNPGGSMGFAKYRIQTLPGLTAGSQIDNFADIYFDYNAPVRTPTATVLIQNPVAASDEVQVLPGFTVFPNPNNGQFAFRSDKAIPSIVNVKLLDLQGRQLWEKELRGLGANQVVQCPTMDLPQGIYLLQLNSAGKNAYLKVVVR